MHPSHPTNIESRIQAAAERAEPLPGTPSEDVAAYREVYRAIREAPMPAIPADFASAMEQLTRDHEEQATPELWMTRGAFCAAIAGVAASMQALDAVAAAFARVAGAVPWSTVVVAALALAVAAMVDRVALQLRAAGT